MISICYAQLCLDTQTAKEEGQGEAPPAGSVQQQRPGAAKNKYINNQKPSSTYRAH